MVETNDLVDCFKDFPKISAFYEHCRTFQIEGYGNRFRIDLWYWHTNEKAPWVAYVHRHEDGDQWQELADFPWVQEKDEQAAIHTALTFLQRRCTSDVSQ